MKRLTLTAMVMWALAIAAPAMAQDETSTTDETTQTQSTESSGSLPDTASPLALMTAAGALALAFGIRKMRSGE